METIGIIALVVVALFLLLFIALFATSIPDLARYRRLRKM